MSARQFDVFANPDPDSAGEHPYFVVLQHDIIGHLNTRIVAPLIAPRHLPLFEKLMPEVRVKGSRYAVDMTNIGPVPARLLENPITNLESARYQIVAAIDLVFTGI
jgi:toxin CcdB